MAFTSITRFLQSAFATPSQEDQQEKRDEAIRTATAAVLLDIAYADDSISTTEEQHLLEFLGRSFGLTEEHARDLLETADELRSGTIDHWNLTNVIRKNTTLDERIEIVKAMWRIVYSDGHLHQYENYIVRKLADLLGLEHHVMIDAKMAVRRE
ncbi:MAG TPA: TerB family tellurite resistance protein [Thermoanaerobaculia bacterium]|nr:TerB family tellurite resistance protein [Thermoanaerobaculia bacterium]